MKSGSKCGFATNRELAAEAGRRGGNAVKTKYGSAHYQALGRKGGKALMASRGSEFYAEIGRRGGEKRGAAYAKARELTAS